MHVDSDNELCCHCLDDVAHPLTCHLIFIPERCMFTLLLLSICPHRSVHLVGDVALPHCSRHWGGRKVAGGGGGNEGEVVDDGGQEGKTLFVYKEYVSFCQTPLTWLSKRHNSCLVIILSNLTKPVNLLFIY